jgi:hypothetical protein
MTITTTADHPATLDEPDHICIAPPCAQPLDTLHKHLYAAFLVVVCLLLYVINVMPPQQDLPPAICAAHSSQ